MKHHWTPLKNAVHDFVRENKILTGRAISINHGFEESKIRVIPDVFVPGINHCFVGVVDARKESPSPQKLAKTQYLDYIHSHVAPLIPNQCVSTLKQINDCSPLFENKVVLLPGSYACFYVCMSICLGDIGTFTSILDHISSLHKGHQPHKINWNNRITATHQLSPVFFLEGIQILLMDFRSYLEW